MKRLQRRLQVSSIFPRSSAAGFPNSDSSISISPSQQDMKKRAACQRAGSLFAGQRVGLRRCGEILLARENKSSWKDFPPEEKDFPPEEKDFPPREKDFPPREKDFPPGEKDFLPGEKDFPPREKDFPPGEKDFFPIGKSFFPIGKSFFPIGKSFFSPRKSFRSSVSR
jgi:hypothetical protein